MTPPTYGLGIIGAGTIFHSHAQSVERLPDRIRLVGVADTDAVKLAHAADRYGVPITTGDHGQILQREDVDLVAVCTPPSTHERLVIEALEAGKHVLCEKPLAHTVAAADRIAAAARRMPGRLSVVYQLRYVPDVQKTLWLRDNGRLGELACGHFFRFDTMAPGAVDWWGRWATAGGGVAMTQFIHQLDLACHVFGPPAEVHAYADTFAHDIESEDTFTATLRFRSGAVASCAATLCGHAPIQQWHIFGTRGSVQNPFAVHSRDDRQLQTDLHRLQQLYPPLSRPVKQPSMRLHARAFRKAMRMLKLADHPTPPRPAPMHLPYYKAVLEALDARQPLPVDADDALVSLELCTAIYISGLTGRPVALPLDRSHPACEGISRDDYQARRARSADDPSVPATASPS